MATTVDWLIDARGDGHGHARRGFLLQWLLAAAGIPALLLIRPGSDRYLPEAENPRVHADRLADPALASWWRRPPRQLVVDTFPLGWRGEWDAASLDRFEHRILIARHGRDLPGATTPYHRVLPPYPEHRSEWEPAPTGARHAGYILDGGHLGLQPGADGCTVLDPEGRYDIRLAAVLARATRRAGLSLDYRRRVEPPGRCRKLLVIGAGYHLFYELVARGLDVRFVPVHKRHDDQTRRAARFGLALTEPEGLLAWLAAPLAPVAEDTQPDWPGLLDLMML